VTIDGKVVAVTGASSGIGEATALLLAQRGAKRVLGARNPDGLDAVAARLSATGGDAIAKVTDVSCREDLTELSPWPLKRMANSTSLSAMPASCRSRSSTSFASTTGKRWSMSISKVCYIAMPPNAVGRAIAFAIDQPADVDIGEVVVRPTAEA
jgi:NADP-dependent 3-hydroxy acid dehydrogenase YdfG